MLFVAHGSPDSNSAFYACANALAHANTLADIVKRQGHYFLDEVTSAWLWDKMSVFGDEQHRELKRQNADPVKMTRSCKLHLISTGSALCWCPRVIRSTLALRPVL